MRTVLQMDIQKIYIEQLVFDPNNARKHDDKNIDAIKGSLVKFGQQKPIIVNSQNIVIAGNGTLTAAIQLGWDSLDCVITELDDFNATAFAIADNRTAELAAWHDDILGKTLQNLREHDFDIGDIGFDMPSMDDEETGTKNNSKEMNENEFDQFDHQCPKCGFEFNKK